MNHFVSPLNSKISNFEKMKIYKFFIVVFCLTFMLSCANDEECRKDRYVQMSALFYTKKLNTSTNTYITSTLTIDSLTAKGVGIDSLLYNNSKGISKINFPLNKFKSESKFSIQFNQSTDTITIVHTNADEYLSLECGCIKVHSIDTVLTTNHFIDSIIIKVHNVNTIQGEHLQIYN